MEIAYTHHKEGETAQAIQTADRFIRQYPNAPASITSTTSRALRLQRRPRNHRAALSQDISERDAKAAREAFDAFKDLVNRFPESR